MRHLFFIAKRYFKTNNSKNFVHIISWVSSFGVVIGTAALILLLSVFNGFENLVLSMYNSFDPELKISLSSGDVFDPKELDDLSYFDSDCQNVVYVLEEKVLLRNKNKDFIAQAKGVSEEYLEMTNFDSLLIAGDYLNKYESNNVAILGRGVAYHLSIGYGSAFNQLQVVIPSREVKTLLNLSSAFNQSSVVPVGIFGIQSEIDETYIITPISFLQDLAKRENKVSSIEIKLRNKEKMEEIQKKFSKALGDKFKVENRYEQQKFLYKILRTEKLAVFLILIFIMIIAAFNIVGSLSMLIIDKTKDIHVLRTLGYTLKDIKMIFLQKSIMTISTGIILGVILGLGIAFLQQKFGFINLGEENFVVSHYPIKFIFKDILYAIISVLTIGIVASLFSIQVLINQLFKK